MKNYLKNAYVKASVLAGGALCSAGSLLAQESNAPQNTQLDTSSVVASAAKIEKGLVDLVEAVVPYIISVLLAVLGLVLIYKVARWLLRAFNTSR